MKLLSSVTRRPLIKLNWLVTALVLLFVALTVPLLLHNSMCLRYQIEIAAPILLLAATGVLCLEQALAGRPALLRIARCVWGLLLIYSVAFNLLLTIVRHAEGHNILGGDLFRRGRVEEAIAQFQTAVNIHPDNVRARHNLGLTLARSGRVADAVEHFARVVRLEPKNAEAHENLGRALRQTGRLAEAAPYLEMAERLKRADGR